MTRQSKDYLTKNALIKQALLIAIIGSVTTILAATLPWMLNTINPDSISTTAPSVTAQIGFFDVFLASDIEGNFSSTSFTPTQTIYLFFNLNDPSGSNMVKTVWSVVDVTGYQPNAVIYVTENKITEPDFTLQTNIEFWEVGKYKIDLYLNDTLDKTIEFEVIN